MESPRGLTPRKRKRESNSFTSKSFSHFEKLSETTENGILQIMFRCKHCNKKVNGTKSWNLASHLEKMHEDIFEKDIKGKKKDSIIIKRLKLLQNCVSIIALGGRPFTYLSDFGFQQIIANKLAKLEAAGCSLNLKEKHQPEVHKHLNEMAEKVREQIKAEVKGRVLSILVDIITKRHRSMLGVSIQYIYAFKLRTRSIGLIELEEGHTGLYLAKKIDEGLKRYEIDKRQIITITADNASNVQKMIRDFAKSAELENQIMIESQKNPSQDPRKYWSNNDTVQIEEERNFDEEIRDMFTVQDISDVEAINLIFEDDENATTEDLNEALNEKNRLILNDVTETLVNIHAYDYVFDINSIRCAEHTLQLANKDALDALPEENKNIFVLCRNISKIFRLKSTKILLNAAGIEYKLPRLEVETRWGSKYAMVC